MKGRDKGLECGTTEGALQPWSGACLGASCSERCRGAAGDQCLGFTIIKGSFKGVYRGYDMGSIRMLYCRGLNNKNRVLGPIIL